MVCADLLAANGVYGSRVLVVAGAGNNGGDALWAGAMLSRRGVQVEALLVASSAHEAGLEALLAAGGRVVTETTTAYDLVLDGVLGIGGRPGLDDDVAKVFDDADAPIVAVDMPSGVEVDTGRLDGSHVTAEVTVTFGTHKVAQLVEPAARACGLVELVDIGLGPYLPDPVLEVLQPDDVRRLLPRPDTTSHKYTRGVLGAVAGSPQYTGAGVLVVSAAVATGLVGMVRYEGASEDLIRAAHPEVVIGPGQVQAWVVGSGIGRGLASSVASVLAERLPTVRRRRRSASPAGPVRVADRADAARRRAGQHARRATLRRSRARCSRAPRRPPSAGTPSCCSRARTPSSRPRTVG